MKRLVALAVMIFITTIGCVLLGWAYQVPDFEKQQGLTGVFAVSEAGVIVFVVHEDGKPTIYAKSNGTKQIAQLASDQAIPDIAIMPNGKTMLYVISDKELSETSSSTVHQVDLETGEDILLFKKDAIITELAIDPGIGEQLFYLQADTYTNYSPIASKRPHDFDIHSYDLVQEKHKQYTNLDKYSMASLQVSSKEESVYVQMDDDAHVQTPEESFETKQRIFQIPLEYPDKPKMIFMPMNSEDLYDFVLIPEQSMLIYQAVAGTNSKGTFEYELFSYNWDTMETKRLTFLKQYTEHPVAGSDGKLYFMVDYNFAGRAPDFSLFRMNPDGSDTEEVELAVEQ